MKSEQINARSAAGLLRLTTKEFNKLVKDGVIPTASPRKFVVTDVVHAYIDHLNSSLGDSGCMQQSELAAHLDISERRLRDLLKELELDHKVDSVEKVRLAYISKLREEAAGRSEKGLAVVRERDTMAAAQLKELELAEKLRLIISIPDLEPMLVNLFKSIQSQMVAAGNRAVQAVEAEHGITIDDDIILKPIRSALGNVAGSADQLSASVTGKPTASVSTAATADGTVDRKTSKTAGRK